MSSSADKLRLKVIEKLGKVCKHCNFSDIRALQIDHVNGLGCEQRKILNQYQILKDALEHPENYQILCANCNWIKKAENNETSKGRRIYKTQTERFKQLLKANRLLKKFRCKEVDINSIT